MVPALYGEEGVYGGAERYVFELARAMAERTPTTLVAFGRHPRRRREANLEVHVLRNLLPIRRFVFDPVSVSLLGELRRADVVHYHQSTTMMATVALAYAHAAGKPIVSTPLGGSGYGLHRLVDVSAHYDAHLHISEFSRRAFGHEGRPNAHVVHGGIDVAKYAPSPDVPFEARRGVLFVGRLLPHKGVNYLVEGCPPDLPLAIVGRRWRHAQRFYELLHELARGKDVSFHEDYDDARTVDAYQRALAIVLPSVHETVFGEHYDIPELLGQTLLEGMAAGAVGIATGICSMPEIVEDGVSGFLVPPNDARALGERLGWLKDHRDDAQRMGFAARRRVLETYVWPKVVDACLAAYDRALHDRVG